MVRLTLFATALMLGVACVPKGKYDDALADNTELHARIDGMQSALDSLKVELESGKTQLVSTRQALDEANGSLASKIAEAGALQENVTQMQQALGELELRRQRTDAALKSYLDLVEKFQAMIDAGTLRVKVIDGRMVVELATDILFPPGSASLSKDGEKAIGEVAKVLASIAGREFQVAGHTDDVPIHTERFPSNWHLGAARAISVVEVMVKAGLDGQRVSAASFAEGRPLDTNRTKEGKAHNRRIEIVVVPDMSTLPGYDELKAISGGSTAATHPSVAAPAPN